MKQIRQILILIFLIGCSQAPSEVAKNTSVNLTQATQPSATFTDIPASKTIIPTNTPDPTNTPTVTPKDLNPGCVNWSQVSLDDVGKELCVYGHINIIYSDDLTNYYKFTENPGDFFFISYEADESTLGDYEWCTKITGEIKELAKSPVIVFGKYDIVESCGFYLTEIHPSNQSKETQESTNYCYQGKTPDETIRIPKLEVKIPGGPTISGGGRTIRIAGEEVDPYPCCPKGCAFHQNDCEIKGDRNPENGERIYYIPESSNYSDILVNPDYGERWFCTEEEAMDNGWRKADN